MIQVNSCLLSRGCQGWAESTNQCRWRASTTPRGCGLVKPLTETLRASHVSNKKKRKKNIYVYVICCRHYHSSPIEFRVSGLKTFSKDLTNYSSILCGRNTDIKIFSPHEVLTFRCRKTQSDLFREWHGRKHHFIAPARWLNNHNQPCLWWRMSLVL